MTLRLLRHRLRHALDVVVEQHQRGLAGPVDEVVAGSGDGAVDGTVGECALGDDADLVGQVVAQRPERNGLIRFQVFDQRRQLVRCRRSRPACARPRAIVHALPSLAILPSAVSVMRLVSGPPILLKTTSSIGSLMMLHPGASAT